MTRLSEQRQPNQPHNNPRHIRVAGTDRIYDRNRLLLVLLVPLMMTMIQVSSVTNILPSLGEALDASPSQLQWVLSGYALALGIVLVPSGRLGDMFGRSTVFVIGSVIFSLASLLVGLATSAPMLNVMRVLQGFGAGVLSPQTTGLIQQYFVGQARAKAFALFGLVVSMSVATGPVMSGVLIAMLGPDQGWRWSFIINFPLGVVGIIMAIKWLPFGKERRHVGRKKKQARHEYLTMKKAEGQEVKPTKIDLDPVGMVLLAFSVLAIMLPFMGQQPAWMWLLFPLGLLLLSAWYFWEKKYKARGREPMVDLELFRIKTFSYATAIAAVMFLGSTSIFVVLALFLQNGMDVSALDYGLMVLPNALVSAIAAVWAGKRAVVHGRGVQVIALVLMLVGIIGSLLLMWGLDFGISYWWLMLPLAILGFGQGAMGSANQTQSMLDVPAEHGGTAGGVMQTAQRIATAIGNAVITAVFLLGIRWYAGDQGYYFGVIISFLLIIAFVMIALVLALIFWRDGYRQRHAQAV
ncbi:MAG: MFS transporter [Actinomycetaceae bacterium]|nr:MFS transporter [Actinomycetaceae bacterium]